MLLSASGHGRVRLVCGQFLEGAGQRVRKASQTDTLPDQVVDALQGGGLWQAQPRQLLADMLPDETVLQCLAPRLSAGARTRSLGRKMGYENPTL
jgi:hypothetical protein